MNSTLDIILMLLVVALTDIMTKISPYIWFAILAITLIYGILKVIDMYLSIKERRINLIK